MSDDLTIPAALDRRSPSSLPAIPPDISVSDAQLPAAYEAAKQALAECESLDECKDWADKAQALASYARQAGDDTLEKQARRIRARAIRRAGQLLKTFDARPGNAAKQSAPGDTLISQADAAAGAGMSKRQQVTAVRVATVPEPQFEEAIEGEKPPTISELASKGIKPQSAPTGFAQATRLLGPVKRFSEFCSEHDPEFIAGGVMDYECADLRKRVANIDAWLDRLVVNLKD